MEDIEASVSTVLMARYREACMSRFNLDVMTPRSASATNLSGKCSSAKSVRVMAAVRSACKKQVKEEGDGTGAHSNAMTVSS
jgi:hypothetical protein